MATMVACPFSPYGVRYSMRFSRHRRGRKRLRSLGSRHRRYCPLGSTHTFGPLNRENLGWRLPLCCSHRKRRLGGSGCRRFLSFHLGRIGAPFLGRSVGGGRLWAVLVLLARPLPLLLLAAAAALACRLLLLLLLLGPEKDTKLALLQTRDIGGKQAEPVLRIRDVYPGSEIFQSRIRNSNFFNPGSKFFQSRIQIFFHPGSRIRIIRIKVF